jgi:hypothetical protein
MPQRTVQAKDSAHVHRKQGLPDSVISNQKSQFGIILGGLEMESASVL